MNDLLLPSSIFRNSAQYSRLSYLYIEYENANI